MRLTVRPSRLIELKSDERDTFALANSQRTAANARGSYAASVTTTDATLTELWRDTVNADSALSLSVLVNAAASPDFAAYWRRYVVSRTGSADAVIQQTDTIGTDFETDPTWDIALSVDGGDVVLSVTGAATWRADVAAVWSPFE